MIRRNSLKNTEHIVRTVIPGSIADEMGIEPGDRLIQINNEDIIDIFDYQYLINDEYIEVLIEKADGDQWLLEIEKEYNEDLGIEFQNSLMDEYKSCYNKCIFCFIDQNPPGMRDTLYFKDDDSRLSFLQGNYITLTNMSDEDVDRIIKYHLAPINISVHTTNQELRCQMLHNRFAGTILERIKRFYEADIPMNAQIVLCRGINDGEELKRTIRDLLEFAPVMESCSVVPVGLTDYREGLCHLEPFDEISSGEVIDIIEGYQREAMDIYGIHFIHASDEWYINAKRPFPEADRYDGYVQIENGVGMMRSLMDEFYEELERLEGDDRTYECSAFTGVLAYDMIAQMADDVMAKFPNVRIHIYRIINDFYGHRITVTGLLTGRDILAQLKGKCLGERLIIPSNAIKNDEDIFLDDMSVTELANALQVEPYIVKSVGAEFIDAVIGGSLK